MSDSKDDEAKFNETLKRMLKTPPKPHKPKPETVEREPNKEPSRRPKDRRP